MNKMIIISIISVILFLIISIIEIAFSNRENKEPKEPKVLDNPRALAIKRCFDLGGIPILDDSDFEPVLTDCLFKKEASQ